MTTRNGLISYDGLPISSGGAHKLGRRSIAEAWSATLHFLTACTTTCGPSKITLSLNHDGSDEQQGLVARLRDRAVADLGVYPSPHERRDYGERGSSLLWRLDAAEAKANDAALWLNTLGRIGTSWLGGVALLSVQFRFRFISDGVELPYQASDYYLGQEHNGYGARLGESGCLLTLSSRCALSTLFSLPFEAPSDDLWTYVAFLQEHLPFTFSERHWSHWRLTKKGTGYVSRKIRDPQLRTA